MEFQVNFSYALVMVDKTINNNRNDIFLLWQYTKPTLLINIVASKNH